MGSGIGDPGLCGGTQIGVPVIPTSSYPDPGPHDDVPEWDEEDP